MPVQLHLFGISKQIRSRHRVIPLAALTGIFHSLKPTLIIVKNLVSNTPQFTHPPELTIDLKMRYISVLLSDFHLTVFGGTFERQKNKVDSYK